MSIEAMKQALEARYSDIVSDGGFDPRNKFDAPPQRTEQRWILVPVTLTNDMTSAMADALEDPNNERSSWDLAENMWQAMLPKVPTPPQRTEPTCPECKAVVLYECVACSSNNYPPKEKT
jgi:hypothetical protein